MPGDIVEIRDLTHDYGTVVALNQVDLRVPSGISGLVGANGAGKTTLLRILLGLLHPTTGKVGVLGTDVADNPVEVRARVGYMPEDKCLPADQTAADFVAYAAELAGLPATSARRRASETLFLVGLHEERFRYLGDFSVGMQQRVKLAQAIVHDPDLVLLDEPASGLDPEGRDQMLDLIKRLGEFGISVFFSSHILSDIEETCDWVVMLDGGRLIRSGPIGDLGSSDSVQVQIAGDVDLVARRLIESGFDVEVQDGHRLAVSLGEDDVYLAIRDAAAAAGAGIVRLGTVAVTLEDVFLSEGTGDE